MIFLGEDIHRGIVTINAERVQRKLKRLVQPLDLLRLRLVFRKNRLIGMARPIQRVSIRTKNGPGCWAPEAKV